MVFVPFCQRSGRKFTAPSYVLYKKQNSVSQNVLCIFFFFALSKSGLRNISVFGGLKYVVQGKVVFSVAFSLFYDVLRTRYGTGGTGDAPPTVGYYDHDVFYPVMCELQL